MNENVGTNFLFEARSVSAVAYFLPYGPIYSLILFRTGEQEEVEDKSKVFRGVCFLLAWKLPSLEPIFLEKFIIFLLILFCARSTASNRFTRRIVQDYEYFVVHSEILNSGNCSVCSAKVFPRSPLVINIVFLTTA